MRRERAAIVNADDLGLTHGVNHGIFRAYDEGIVTSTSALVRRPACADAAEGARARPELSVGLHVDLGEWRFDGDRWVNRETVVDVAARDDVEAEVRSQVGRFQHLFARNPSHLDGHQHVHLDEPVRSVVVAIAAQLAVPVRGITGPAYWGHFYGQTGTGEPLPEAITREALVELLGSLPEGLTEIGCHPGYAAGLDDTYTAEREAELAALCDGVVREAVEREQIELVSFATAARWRTAHHEGS